MQLLEAIQREEEAARRLPVVVVDPKENKGRETLPIVEWDGKGGLRLLPENLEDEEEGGGGGGGVEEAGGKGKGERE